MRSSFGILFAFSALLLQVLASPTAVPSSLDSVQERDTPSDVNIVSNDLHERHDVDDHDNGHDDDHGTGDLEKRISRGTWMICKENHLFYMTSVQGKPGYAKNKCPICKTNGDKVVEETQTLLMERRKARNPRSKGWNFQSVYHWNDGTSSRRSSDGASVVPGGSHEGD
ncbi:hypothetical protein MMC09_001625 [Bachmanniomyces sp. S44760]|nr:hypothetical protein [Bachmanniomyces sp. S44760]